MHAMNGLTHTEVAQLKRQLELELADARKAMLEEFSNRRHGVGGSAFREGIDAAALPNAVPEPDLAIVGGALAARRAIEGAFAAIEAGTYGACENCGRHIGLKRLRALPATAVCVRCERRLSEPVARTKRAPAASSRPLPGRSRSSLTRVTHARRA
jgi:DnaK suppressor protein